MEGRLARAGCGDERVRRFAQETTISVEKSKAEIEGLLTRYGATSFMSGSNQVDAMIAFEMRDRKIIFRMRLPSKQDRRFTHTPQRELVRDPDEATREWEQACRSRWRALALRFSNDRRINKGD